MTHPPRRFSLAALTVLGLSPPDMVSAAAAAGYQHVGLRLIPATRPWCATSASGWTVKA
jgi:hypothetical protein